MPANTILFDYTNKNDTIFDFKKLWLPAIVTGDSSSIRKLIFSRNLEFVIHSSCPVHRKLNFVKDVTSNKISKV